MRRVYVISEKWRRFGLWRLVLFRRLWRDMDQADRNYLRSWIGSQP